MDEDNINNEELYHYGVLGMKWGIRRAGSKQNAVSRLNKRIKKYEVKSANLKKKAEKIHAKEDLGASNKSAIKAANLRKKAAKLRYQSTNAEDDLSKNKYAKKAAKLELKAVKKDLNAEQLSKSVPYGEKAMKYSIKSDKAKVKAEKAKAKLASNELFIKKMNSKVNSLTPEKREEVQRYIDKYLN